ncbi:unnamed protein product [Cuscuta epithymum]|uniref:C2 NT-type domain-containing protein n=1 Tax=Cuscuta epithymum TaxID=186058 RepID=A0AAV0EYE5_9ASTE|nr:unnamed protein product [Cuscuta epithymum]
MSRNTKWKLEKNKVKVVFRLQFHATHIPQTGWDKLFVSFIPADSGKTTAKTTKANVRNGTCKWADPIYETTRLLQDVKTKEYDEKLYKLVVAMGSSRASILGEASLNLAEHVDASKPSIVALPLHGCDTGAILHVTVHLLTSKTGFREFEQQRELRERGLQSGIDNKPDDMGTGKVSVSRDDARDETEKANRRSRFRPDAKEILSVEEVEEHGDLTIGFDGSSNTSESFYAEKNDYSSTQEIGSLKTSAFGDSHETPHCQSPQPRLTNPFENQAAAHGSSDSIHGWVSDCSDENSRTRASLELAETSVFELKLEVSSLQGQVDELGMETDKFSSLLAAEISSGEELAKEVSSLKLERLKIKDDIERLHNLKISPQCTEKQDVRLVQEIQDKWSIGISILEERIRDLKKKTFHGLHEGEHGFLKSEFEVVLQILNNMKQGSKDEACLPNIAPPLVMDAKEIRDTCLQKTQHSLTGLGLDLDLCPPEDILHHFSIPPLVVAQGPNFDLIRELDEAKFERETLVKKMDQMECYYEALVQELEENQKRMLTELQSLRNEHSTCIYTNSINEAEIESLRQDMNLKIAQLVDENRNLDAINKELEERATSSEAALRRARMNYSIAVEKLQKDLELLSSQVVSMFQTNENLIKQAFLEPSVADNFEYVNGFQNSEQYDTTKQLQFCNQNLWSRKQAVCRDVLLEDLKKSLFLQEKLYMKVEEDLNEMHSVNFYLDVYSKAVVETLLEAYHNYALMKKYVGELARQLEFSNECNDQLATKLQVLLEDIVIVNGDKDRCMHKCNELVRQNQNLADQLEMISKENSLLTEKLMDGEIISTKFQNFLSKYESCLEQKAELSSLLEHRNLEIDRLHTEISVLKEDLKIVELERDKLASSEKTLQKNASFVQHELVNLLASYDQQLSAPLLVNPPHLDLDLNNFKGLLVQVDEIQHKSCAQIIQLMEEKKRLEIEKHDSELSLSSEIIALKQNLKNNTQDMSVKLSTSNALVEKLQFELEYVENKLRLTSEIEKKHALQEQELLADLSLFEIELQRTAYFVQEKLDLDYIADEIERSSSTICRLLQDNQDLVMSLQSKTEDISSLKENLKILSDEMHSDRDSNEGRVQELTFELNEKNNCLLDLEKTNSKLIEEKQDLVVSFQCAIAESANLATEISSLKENLRGLHDELHSERDSKAEIEATARNLAFQLNEKLESLHAMEKQNINLIQEKHNLIESLNCKAEESIDMIKLKENLETLYAELNAQKGSNVELEGRLRDLSSELNVKHLNLLDLEKLNTELVHFREQASELEVEKSRLHCLLLQKDESMRRLELHMHESLIASDVKYTFAVNQYGSVAQKLVLSDECLGNLREQCDDLQSKLNHSFAGEAHHHEEKLKLLEAIDTVRSDLEASFARNKVLSDCNSNIQLKVEEYENEITNLEVCLSKAKHCHTLEVEHLKDALKNSEEEICYLIVSTEELGVMVTFLRSKFDELLPCMNLLEKYKDEQQNLQCQYNELSYKLSQQCLETEEFRNLSVQLKESRDKADEQKESRGQPVARQESLRIAFIKEQYETKVQELKQQLSISRRHGEDMLLKLQDAIDENECMKKADAIQAKRNEELALKLLDLESELQSVLYEKREITKAHDRIKAELECAVLSLECSKEEKEKVEASLQSELSAPKQLMENVKCQSNSKEAKHATDKSIKPSAPNSSHQDGMYHEENLSFQHLSIEDLPSPHIDLNNNLFETQNLRAGMDHLHEELERLKNENSQRELLVPKDHFFNPDFEASQRELEQLQKTNEDLGSMFPLFNEITTSGKALEGVIALEVELAEALKAKTKPNIICSSFLKQNSDEEAIFKRFRDINVVLKEMLELKGRHATVENELKDMHDRYTQLSLKFAEVEGEKQKLKMTLKNLRGSRKLNQLDRSSSSIPAESSFTQY